MPEAELVEGSMMVEGRMMAAPITDSDFIFSTEAV